MSNIFVFFLCMTSLFAQSKPELYMLSDKEFFSTLEQEKIIEEKEAIAWVEAAVFHLSNAHRLKKKREKLTFDQNLHCAGRVHNEEMQKHQFFDHLNKRTKDLRTPMMRVERCDAKPVLCLENIAFEARSSFSDKWTAETIVEMAKTVTQGWIQSKSHNANLLDKEVTHMSVAVSLQEVKKQKTNVQQIHFTQVFAAYTKTP